MSIFHLYIKTHNKTGLKYLGITTNDNPEKYTGSGKYWKRHIKKHGNDVNTEILLSTTDHFSFRENCRYYSKLFDIVASKQWANFITEDGGSSLPIHLDTKNKISASNKGRKMWINDGQQNKFIDKNDLNLWPDWIIGKVFSDETRQKISDNAKLRYKDPTKNPRYGIEVSDETRRKMSLSQTGKTIPEERRKRMSETLKGKKKPASYSEKLSKRREGSIWATDGTQNKQCSSEASIPDGWRRGLTKFSGTRPPS